MSIELENAVVRKSFPTSSEWRANDTLFASNPMYSALISKALEAGTGVDAASFTGGRSLQHESLEASLLSITLAEEDARLWRAISKKPIAATVDQYTRRTGFGGRWGTAAAESSNPTAHVAALARAFANVKFYRDYREISDVSMLVSNIERPEAEEEQAGLLNIIHALNEDMYWSNGDVYAQRVDGIFNHLTTSGVTSTIVDLNGAVFTVRDPFNDAVALVRNHGGRITHAFMNPLLGEDFSKVYSSAERIMLSAAGAGVYAGVDIAGLQSQFGKVDFEFDPFNYVGWVSGSYPGGAGDATLRPAVPATLTASATGTSCTDANLPANSTGYMYNVSAVNEQGESAVKALSAVVTKTATQNIELVIGDPVSGGTVTGYRIYRSRPGATTASETRFLCQVARTGATTTYTDNGTWVPGTAHVALLDMRPQAQTIQWSQLLPAGRKNLAETGPTRPFLVNLYGAFRIAKPEWLGMLKNVLPLSVSDSGWKPVTAI